MNSSLFRPAGLMILCTSLLWACAFPGCSHFSPSGTRQQELAQLVRKFHWSMMSDDVSGLIHTIGPESREHWKPFFECLLREYQIIDCRIESVEMADENREATVLSRITLRPKSSLSVEEFVIIARGTYVEKRWQLEPVRDGFRSCCSGCL